MSITTPEQGVRAFAPMNFLGAPRVVYAPEAETATAPTEMSVDQAAAAYIKATTPDPVPLKDQVDGADQDEGEPADDELQASEDAGESDDGETTAEDQAGEDDEEPEIGSGKFAGDSARVKLPDGTFTTVADLKSGSLRNADYTQKTQALAADRKAVGEQSERIKASEKQLNDERAYVAALVKSILPARPDPALADPNSPNYDPARYQAEEVRFRQWGEHLTYIESQQQRAEKERQAQGETESTAKLEKEWATALEKLPELKDPKRLEAFGKDTLKFGATYGYSPQELANIHHDHRQLVVMKKAIAWDKLQASKATVAQKVEGRPPVQKGGKRSTPSEARARSATDAINTAKKTGTVEDVARAFLARKKG